MTASQFLRHLLLVGIGVVMFYPLAWMIGASLRDDSAIADPGIWPGSRFTADGYTSGWRGVAGIEFWRFMLNSFLVAALCVAANLLACALTAYAFARIPFRFRGVFFAGSVSPEIRPLWRTKAAGFAVTCRHVPTQQSVPTMSPDDYTKWAYEYWYGKVFKHDLADQIDETTFLVVDTCNTPTPAVGSMDSMVWAALGARGVVTNGGTRDSDETLEQKAIPIWSRWIVQPMYQGRVEGAGTACPSKSVGSSSGPPTWSWPTATA